MVTLDAHGFWGDEINSLDSAALGFPTIITGRFGYLANQTPLHYFTVWLTLQLSDPTLTSVLVRLPSLIAGCLSILLIYALGKEMFGKAEGLFAAILLMLSATHLNFSQDLRLYSMMLFLTTAAIYSLLKADHTGSPWWWAAFAFAAIANVSNAYVALTLSIPALLPYLAYVLWKKWRFRREASKALLYGVVASIALLLGVMVNVFDLLNAPRVSPVLSKLPIADAAASALELLAWFTPFGIGGSPERLLQLALLLMALVGLLAAIAHPMKRERSRSYESAVLCALFIVVPAVMLAVFATTSVVFQRYALFAMPFYFILIGHGLVALYAPAGSGIRNSLMRIRRAAAAALALLIIAAFAIGAYLYENPNTHINMAYRPDFRGVARYLSQKVKAGDTVVFLDDPGLGYTITNFYWKNHPPTGAYDARDPRLFVQQPKGDVYWVISMERLSLLDLLSAPDMGWSEVAAFERVRVLHETHPGSIQSSMGRIVSKLEQIWPGAQPVIVLRGCLQQAAGQLDQAAKTYQLAGTYFPVGDDYLRAAIGYDALGYDTFAWREAFISKFWQPFRPEIHEWLARKLQEGGFEEQSKAEAELARLLMRSK